MAVFPTLKLLALNAVVDNGLEMSPLLVGSNPFHTKSILAVLKQPILAPVNIALPRHIEVKSTAFDLGVYFCLYHGIDVVCQLAQHNQEDNIISYGRTDMAGDILPYGYMVEVYYDSSIFRAGEIVCEMFTLGFDTGIPQYAVSEYISVQYGYFTADDVSQQEQEVAEYDVSSVESEDFWLDMFPTPPSAVIPGQAMSLQFEDREMEEFLNNNMLDMDYNWGSSPAEGIPFVFPESQGWGASAEDELPDLDSQVWRGNLQQDVEEVELSTRTTIIHKMTFLYTGDVLLSESARGLSQQCSELLYGSYNTDNVY